jgi:anti-anti-sigma factor
MMLTSTDPTSQQVSEAHFRVTGPLNLETIPTFERVLQRELRGTCGALRLDLVTTDYVDSDGVRWLQQLQKTLADRGVQLRLLVREKSRVDRTFRLLQLESAFLIERQRAEGSAPIRSAA